jgi:hypothetical protein
VVRADLRGGRIDGRHAVGRGARNSEDLLSRLEHRQMISMGLQEDSGLQ